VCPKLAVLRCARGSGCTHLCGGLCPVSPFDDSHSRVRHRDFAISGHSPLPARVAVAVSPAQCTIPPAPSRHCAHTAVPRGPRAAAPPCPRSTDWHTRPQSLGSTWSAPCHPDRPADAPRPTHWRCRITPTGPRTCRPPLSLSQAYAVHTGRHSWNMVHTLRHDAIAGGTEQPDQGGRHHRTAREPRAPRT